MTKKLLLIEANFSYDNYRVHAFRGFYGTPGYTQAYQVLVSGLPDVQAAIAWCQEHHPGVDVTVDPVVAKRTGVWGYRDGELEVQ